jgi:hypothetical protein
MKKGRVIRRRNKMRGGQESSKLAIKRLVDHPHEAIRETEAYLTSFLSILAESAADKDKLPQKINI